MEQTVESPNLDTHHDSHFATAGFTCRWIDQIRELERLEKKWEQLAGHAAWPNAANEANYLIPAIRHLGQGQVRVLIVESGDQLCGLFPFQSTNIYHFPLPSLELWKHDQCFDATPLVRSDCAAEVLEYVFRQLAAENISLLSLDTVAAESPFNESLSSSLRRLNLVAFQRDRFTRAAFRPAASYEEYRKAHVSKSVQKNCKRLSRRLGEQGELRIELSDSGSDFEWLASEFLRIEKSGWKGSTGTALASSLSTQDFYREMIRRSAALGKARFLTLSIDRQPIAMLSDLISRGQLFSFKTAFDDAWSKFSPGQQLELKNIEFLHQQNLVFADSCSTPDNQSIQRIWGQQVTFQNLVIGLRPGAARWATRLMPWMQTASKQFKRFHRD